MVTKRITVADCEKLLVNIGKKGKFRTWNGVHPMPKVGGYFYIGMAYGRPRLHYAARNGGESDVSPRLPTGKLHEWMRDFGVSGFRDFLKWRRTDWK